MRSREEYPPHLRRAIEAAERTQTRSSPAGAAASIDDVLAKGVGVAPASPYRSRLEADYAAHLDGLRASGEILAWWYEPMTFHLGGGVKWKADWLLMYPDAVLEVRETKGHWRRGERERIKLAAALFPFGFVAVTREDGVWQEERF